MTTAALHRSRPAVAPERSPSHELGWSLVAGGGLAAILLSLGLVDRATPYTGPWTSWCLVGAGIVGTHLASRNIPWGWLLLVSLQPMWIVYAISTEQYGFVVGAIAYGAGQLNGFLRSRRGADRAKEESS